MIFGADDPRWAGLYADLRPLTTEERIGVMERVLEADGEDPYIVKSPLVVFVLLGYCLANFAVWRLSGLGKIPEPWNMALPPLVLLVPVLIFGGWWPRYLGRRIRKYTERALERRGGGAVGGV